MPYIKTDVDFIEMRRLIKGYVTAPDLAKVIEKSAPTARDRLNNPEMLTLGELKKISQRLHIPKDELFRAIRW